MPRYEVTLVLTLDAETQHEAAEAADEFAGFCEDYGHLMESHWPPGDTTLRPKAISWPID